MTEHLSCIHPLCLRRKWAFGFELTPQQQFVLKGQNRVETSTSAKEAAKQAVGTAWAGGRQPNPLGWPEVWRFSSCVCSPACSHHNQTPPYSSSSLLSPLVCFLHSPVFDFWVLVSEMSIKSRQFFSLYRLQCWSIVSIMERLVCTWCCYIMVQNMSWFLWIEHQIQTFLLVIQSPVLEYCPYTAETLESVSEGNHKSNVNRWVHLPTQ